MRSLKAEAEAVGQALRTLHRTTGIKLNNLDSPYIPELQELEGYRTPHKVPRF
ncbi:MAG: hypothetical protein F6K26_00960 [Moorea sp. SIO2I5]|nr:hypothetical protein [Moorena sp. SIO2I5]